MIHPPLLELRGFRVAFGPQPVLRDVNLSLPARGLTVLVGPAGSGKSTLVRTLVGLNHAHPSLVTGGLATFAGQRLSWEGPPPRIGYVMQKARFLVASVRENLAEALPCRHTLGRAAQLEVVTRLLYANGLGQLVRALEQEVVTLPSGLQRRLAVARALAADPLLLLVDEPTAGLSDAESEPLLELLRHHATQRAVLVVTHHQAHARILGGMAALLAEGRIQEVSPTEAFFTAPWTPAGQVFVSTGGYCRPPPDEEEAPRPKLGESDRARTSRPATGGATVPSFFGPLGFYWIQQGRLGGLPRPGIVAALEEDLQGLRRLGVTRLVTLEETATVPAEALAACGMRGLHVAVADMGVPELGTTWALCEAVERELQAGQVVAFHCRAGLGRTGTLLACQLIFEGATAVSGLEAVRQINPRCIQSEPQAAFLSVFERFRDAASGVRPPPEIAPLQGRNPQS